MNDGKRYPGSLSKTRRLSRGARWLAAVALSCAWLVPAANAQPTESFHYSTQTDTAQAVAKSREAVIAGNWKVLPTLAQQAKGDPLEIYADFWNVLGALKQADTVLLFPEGERFLETWPDTYMADRVRAEWVLRAAELGEFGKVMEIGDFLWMNPQVRCSRLHAEHMTTGHVEPEVARVTFAPGKACWAMADRLARDGVLTAVEVEPMVLDYLEQNHTRTAGRLAPMVFKGDARQQYNAAMANPKGWLQSRGGSSQLEGDDALLVAIALSRLAREEPSSALAALQSTWDERLPAEYSGWVRSQMALRSALNQDMATADLLYREAPEAPLTDSGYAWRTRAALRQPDIDWAWVQETIEDMPAPMQEDSAWMYWKARALQAHGDAEGATEIFTEISPRLDFYGQLATEELGDKIMVPQAPEPVTQAELQKARDNPHLQQAVALFRQGWRPQAVPQWNYALRGLDDRELLAAAEFAREQQIYDRVVNTSERTRDSIDFSQRFIAPFEGQVSSRANAIGLDPAWVYGLIRQESRFVMDARSVAGASGLMQLMPATARHVARRIGMKDFHPSRVNDFDVNTELGTAYLRMVLNDLDNSQVLASAGYNAGPGRPRNWRASLTHPVEGAIFAETIPFTETRDYVKQVLSNATYYAAVFTGEPQSLKERLGEISRKGQ